MSCDKYKTVEECIRSINLNNLYGGEIAVEICQNKESSVCDKSSEKSEKINVIGIPPLQNQNLFFDFSTKSKKSFHLDCPTKKPIYQLLYPGAFLIPNYLSFDEQIFIAAECLLYFIQSPNKTNLSNSENVLCDIWKKSVLSKDNKIFKKLRWATLGYQYNWSDREYKDFVDFPESLLHLCKNIALHFDIKNFQPQAAILNIYHYNDRLRGHKDDIENNKESPLISISLGLPCVFLLGGETRNETPQPIILRSGDVLVLAGKARQLYHGVAKLLCFDNEKNKSWNKSEKVMNEKEQKVAQKQTLIFKKAVEKDNLILFKEFVEEKNFDNTWKDNLAFYNFFRENENGKSKNIYEPKSDKTIEKNNAIQMSEAMFWFEKVKHQLQSIRINLSIRQLF